MEVLAELLGKIRSQMEALEEKYLQLMAADEEHYADREVELNAEADRADAAVNRILRAVEAGQDSPSQRPGTSPATTAIKPDRVKPNKALEPHVVSRDHNTVEMKSWCKKFKAWFTSSNMAAASVQEEQAYFRMVIDVHLEMKLSTKIQETMPVFGSDTQVSGMGLLEEEFLVKYPLLARRVEFFESTQTTGQSFSDWSSKVKALGDEATLSDLSTDGIYVMRYITGTVDMKLRERFLKEESPTMEVLDKIAHRHNIKIHNA